MGNVSMRQLPDQREENSCMLFFNLSLFFSVVSALCYPKDFRGLITLIYAETLMFIYILRLKHGNETDGY